MVFSNHRSSSSSDSGIWVVAAMGIFTLGVLSGYAVCRSMQLKLEDQNDDDDINKPAPRRYGAVIQLKPEKYIRYRELHDKVWPAVLQRIYDSNIRNFVIYYHQETSTLYQHFEWIGHWKNNNKLHGDDTIIDENELFLADMAAISADPVTKKWWKECEPCQIPFTKPIPIPPSDGGTDSWWTSLECVCHCGYFPIQYSKAAYDPDFRTLDTTK